MTRADFNELVQQLSRKLYGYAFRILLSKEEAEDAVQEIFIKLWKMRDKLGQYNSPEALATTMTKNYCIDQLRKRSNLRFEDENRQNYNYITTQTPHEQMELAETNEILHKIIDQLPEGYRIMVRLRDVEGFAYEEIAEKTGQNVNTLRVTLSRARKLIRDEFNKYQYEPKGVKKISRKVF